MMEAKAIGAFVRRHAQEHDLVIWESFPWGGATVLWPEEGDLETFLNVARRVGARMIYVQDGGDLVGFAADGVVHAFASLEMRPRLVEEPMPDEAEFDADEDDGLVDFLTDHRDPYYDYRLKRTVEGELRELVDRIVADHRFDGYRSRRLAYEYTAHLDAQDAETVQDVAGRVFEATVDKEFDNRVQRLLPDLVSDPEFDPLAWGEDLHDFLTSRLSEEDPRVLERLRRELPSYAWDSGLARKAEREVEQFARRVLETMTQLVRDQLGFASKNTTRLQIVDAYLNDLPDRRKSRVLQELVSLESALHAATREARYATAVRKLLERGVTKAEASRRLGISTKVMDRIVGTHRSDVDFDAADPIVTTLAPELD